MIIGIDLDNTIACYETAFYSAARASDLVPVLEDSTKSAVRNYLRAQGREDDWTKLQGYVYGARMDLVTPCNGVTQFLSLCGSRDVQVRVISHRTQFPYLGDRYDLHAAARDWLDRQGFFSDTTPLLQESNVYLEETISAKLARIGSTGCTHFIDDLTDVLGHAEFPDGVERLLFDPDRAHQDASAGLVRHESWHSISTALLDVDAI